MESAADQARKKAYALSVEAAKAGSSEAVRRAFVTQLITLPSYHNFLCTQYFSSLVPKYFRQFEDLQDAAVDAVLDLCEDEDEAVRILGIQGLGQTAKADVRWVKGNAGVLLQLLECPEKELKVVKETLGKLLDLSMSQVLSVMADDCKGSEQETGASRHNIIKYLHNDWAATRRAKLDTGISKESEDIFREGFMDVLKTASPADALLILDMLVTLPNVSGMDVDKKTTTTFIRALSDSLESGSRPKQTKVHIQLFAQFVNKAPTPDPLAALYFFERHGGAVASELLAKEDSLALGLVKKLQGWAQIVVEQWERGGQSEEEGLIAKRTALPIIDELLGWFDELRRDDSIKDYAANIEHLLLPVYHLIKYRDRRSDIVSHSKDRKLFLDIAAVAKELDKSRDGQTSKERCIRNIATMATILGSKSTPFESITPSWMSAPPAPLRGTQTTASTSKSVTSTVSGTKPPSGPRGSHPNRVVAYVPRSAPTGPSRSVPTSTPTEPQSNGRSYTPVAPSAGRSIPPASPSRPSPPTAPSISVRGQAPIAPGLPIQGRATATPSISVRGQAPPAAGLSVHGRAVAESTAGNARANVIDMTADDVPSSSRGKNTLPVKPTSSTPPVTDTISSRGKELIIKPQNPRPTPGSIDVTMDEESTRQNVGSAPRSLLARINKRPLDDAHPPSAPSGPKASKSSLGSRIGPAKTSHSDEPEVKRSKPDPGSAAKQPLSSRMSGPDGLINRTQAHTVATAQSSAQSNGPSSSLPTDGQFRSPNPPSIQTSTKNSRSAPDPLSIRDASNRTAPLPAANRSSSASRPPPQKSISIVGKSKAPSPEKELEYHKKGRGHSGAIQTSDAANGRSTKASGSAAPPVPKPRIARQEKDAQKSILDRAISEANEKKGLNREINRRPNREGGINGS